MSNDVELQEAKEGLESLGMWMDARHNSRFVGTPIQTWDIPKKEKGFFTVYAMNLVLESNGFEGLAAQETEDVGAFIDLLHRIGAKKTSAFIKHTVAAMTSKASCDKDKCTSDYYDLFERDKVWLKILDYVGRRIFVGYLLKAQAIEDAGGSTFDPQQWEGNLPDAS
ncbi:MAG: hypothetical protein ABIR24_07820 [Verrucomicrobiota bacterium]